MDPDLQGKDFSYFFPTFLKRHFCVFLNRNYWIVMKSCYLGNLCAVACKWQITQLWCPTFIVGSVLAPFLPLSHWLMEWSGTQGPCSLICNICLVFFPYSGIGMKDGHTLPFWMQNLSGNLICHRANSSKCTIAGNQLKMSGISTLFYVCRSSFVSFLTKSIYASWGEIWPTAEWLHAGFLSRGEAPFLWERKDFNVPK